MQYEDTNFHKIQRPNHHDYRYDYSQVQGPIRNKGIRSHFIEDNFVTAFIQHKLSPSFFSVSLSLSHSVFYIPVKITHKSNYTLFLPWPDPVSFRALFYVISTWNHPVLSNRGLSWILWMRINFRLIPSSESIFAKSLLESLHPPCLHNSVCSFSVLHTPIWMRNCKGPVVIWPAHSAKGPQVC